MAKTRRDLVNQFRKEAADYDMLHEAYKTRENGGDMLKMTLSAHYDKMAELAAKHASQLDTATS